jgi:serine/threonine-protein kinase
LGEGGFASVYKAFDTVMGLYVALKIPHQPIVTEELLDSFRREVRIAARLEHEHILQIKDADFINGRFVIVFPLAEKTLEERLAKRISFESAMDLGWQLLEAVAFAHEHGVIHCDIKPENVMLFPHAQVRLADFGIARVARGTIQASGAGTVGYMPPEQAMGKPSRRSDVFSVGLILYRMLTGTLPEWPFDWPGPGYHRLRGRAHPDLIALLKRAIDPNPRKRFRDAEQMLSTFESLYDKAIRHARRRR